VTIQAAPHPERHLERREPSWTGRCLKTCRNIMNRENTRTKAQEGREAFSIYVTTHLSETYELQEIFRERMSLLALRVIVRAARAAEGLSLTFDRRVTRTNN